jgi:hypothetical protein
MPNNMLFQNIYDHVKNWDTNCHLKDEKYLSSNSKCYIMFELGGWHGI